jgi:hypothetical protein
MSTPTSTGHTAADLARSMKRRRPFALTVLEDLEADGYARRDEHGHCHATDELERLCGAAVRAAMAGHGAELSKGGGGARAAASRCPTPGRIRGRDQT